VPVGREFVSRRARIFCALLTITCVLRPELVASAEEATVSVDIGKSEIGAPPAEFEFQSENDDKHGSWTVVHDPTTETGVAIERAGMPADEDHPTLAVYKPTSVKNAEISLRLNATGGKSDRGGGLAVRLSDPQNYYLVQLDALRDRVLFSLLRNGVSEEIVAVDADITSHAWHTLTVRSKDDKFVVSLDGTWVFTGFDKTLSQPGRIALWTEGDSLTRFDRISITPLATSGEKYR
jgi:hypothetical protein